MYSSDFSPSYGPSINVTVREKDIKRKLRDPLKRYSDALFSTENAYVDEKSEILIFPHRFKLDSPHVAKSKFDKFLDKVREVEQFQKLSDNEKLLYLLLKRQAEKKARKSSIIERFLMPLASIILEGLPNVLSPSVFQRAFLKFIAINEDYASKNKFEFLLLDLETFSSYKSDSSTSLAKAIVDFIISTTDPLRAIMNLLIRTYYTVGFKYQLDALSNLDTTGIDAKTLAKSAYVISMFLLFESIVYRFYIKSINEIPLPEIQVERIAGQPYYYFSEIRPPETISMSFLDSKRGTIIRLLESWRAKAFGYREPGFLMSNHTRGYVFNSTDLYKARYLGIILPLSPSSLRFDSPAIDMPDENRMLTYPRIMLKGLFPTHITGINFSQEAGEPQEYSVTFAVEDVELARLF